MLNKEQEKALVELLAMVYRAVNWGKMRTSKNPHDIFNHRVRAAARRSTLYEFVSKLCNYFGLQSLPANAQPIVDTLRDVEQKVLNVLSTEHIPFCVRAVIRAKEMKVVKSKENLTIFDKEDENESSSNSEI